MVTGPDVIRIAARATVSPSTVKRVLAGAGNANNRERVRDAALQLGLADLAREIEQQQAEAAHG